MYYAYLYLPYDYKTEYGCINDKTSSRYLIRTGGFLAVITMTFSSKQYTQQNLGYKQKTLKPDWGFLNKFMLKFQIWIFLFVVN